MPIDPMMLDPMLGTFRNMLKECRQKGLSGDDFEAMVAAMQRMEQLGAEHSDFAAFSGQLMQENLFGKFSDHYGRALAAQARAAQGGDSGGYDDAAMLKQTLDGLRQAIKTMQEGYQAQIDQAKRFDPHAAVDEGMAYAQRSGLLRQEHVEAVGGMQGLKSYAREELDKTLEEKPAAFDGSVEVEVLSNPELVVRPIEELIALGEQPGMTLPRFLRIQIEQGLDKAMEGAGQTRRALDIAIGWAKANPPTPYHLEKAEEERRAFDRLASAQPFGVPNWKELSQARDDIDRVTEPKIREWEAIKNRWEAILFDLSQWSLSYTSFAPFIDPWRMAQDPRKAAKRTQDVTPGLLKQRERLLTKYFDLDFRGIFKHPSFWWDVQWDYLGYSQEFVEFLIERVYPQCMPFRQLDAETIERRKSFYGSKDQLGREGNPRAANPPKRQQAYYDSLFGEGRFRARYGPIEEPATAAAPWNWEAFEYGR